MMTSATLWGRKTKLSSFAVWVILVIFSLSLSCLAKTPPKIQVEVNVKTKGNGSDGNFTVDEEPCDPVDHGEGRGGIKCLGCHYSADPAPKNCDERKVYECYKGEVCVTRLQRARDSGKGNIEKGCTSMFKDKQFNKWIDVRGNVMGDLQSQELLCNDTDCCNKSDDPYDAAVSFKASLLITVIMIGLTKLTKIYV